MCVSAEKIRFELVGVGVCFHIFCKATLLHIYAMDYHNVREGYMRVKSVWISFLLLQTKVWNQLRKVFCRTQNAVHILPCARTRF